MPEEFDFSELRNYLQGQIDMGLSDVYLDEPWTLQKLQRAAAPAPKPVMPTPPQPAAQPVRPAPATQAAQAAPAQEPPIIPAVAMPAARPAARKASAAFESAESLDAFYAAIQGEAIYSGISNLARYEGPENPKLLLLMPNPLSDQGNYLSSEAGQMLIRLFANLKITEDSIGVAYFYKGHTARNIPPLFEAALRKMLTKELSFVKPDIMVSFGEGLFHQLFGKGKNFNDLAGTDLEFSGIKTCALVDAVAMSQDKQLKWLTWKVHLPKSSYFS